jgi:hypothetical protein
MLLEGLNRTFAANLSNQLPLQIGDVTCESQSALALKIFDYHEK